VVGAQDSGQGWWARPRQTYCTARRLLPSGATGTAGFDKVKQLFAFKRRP